MFTVSSTIKLNFGVIKELERNAQTALELTTEELLTQVENAQVIPFADGQLKDSAFADCSNSAKGHTSIVFDTAYARRWYYNPETVNVRDYVIKKGKRKGQHVNSYIATKATFHTSVWNDTKGRTHGAHAKAKDNWLEDWLPGGIHEDFCVETFAKIYRRLNQS